MYVITRVGKNHVYGVCTVFLAGNSPNLCVCVCLCVCACVCMCFCVSLRVYECVCVILNHGLRCGPP